MHVGEAVDLLAGDVGGSSHQILIPVSYTHLDVYKRQYLSDACAHVASAEYTNFHAKINLSLSLFADG